MNKSALMKWIPLSVLFLACACAQSQEPPNSTSGSSAPRRVEVDADTASSLVVEKAPINYPDAARTAGLEGTVVLKVATTYSGDVEEVTVLSGDPALAQAAVDAVKKWKYKPYLSEGSPAGMETQVTINFHLKARAQPPVLPLGVFRDNAYSNDYLGIYYPLSRDWVLETNLMRGKLASEGKGQGTYVLLSAVHIPQNTAPLTADSSFVVLALGRTGTPAPDDCKRYLESAADGLHSRKEGQLKGGLTQFSIAGHDFYRGDFEFRHGIDHGALLCTADKDYLLQWEIRGWSKRAIETAISTLDSMTPVPATPPQAPDILVGLSKVPLQVRVSQGVSTGLRIKDVAPVYPPEARYARIQGSVLLKAVINKNGDIEDLEILHGPIELVVSAVNAVRQWKYRPYLLKGNPVDVETQITVNYALSP